MAVSLSSLIALDNQTPTSAGELGMNSSTGRPLAYIGGGSKGLAITDEVMLLDGSQAMTGNLDMDSNELLNVANASSGTSAPSWSQVQDYVTAALDALELCDGVDAATTSAVGGSATLSGATLTANSNGAFGTVDGVAAGSGKTYLLKDESSTKNGVYTLTTVGSAGAPWVLTRRSDFAVGDTVFGKIVPVKAGTANGGLAYRVTAVSGSDTVGTHTISYAQWGATSDHGSLVGLGDDDHAQYALGLGRSGGQTLIGGTGAAEVLTLRGTSHTTPGMVDIIGPARVNANVTVNGDYEIKPATSGEGKLGTSAKKFAQVNAVAVNSGDLRLTSPDIASADWVCYEQEDGLMFVNIVTQRCMVLPATRMATSEEMTRAMRFVIDAEE